MESLNNKRCVTCGELSTEEFDKCQYCGSVLVDNLDYANSDVDTKTIGIEEDIKSVAPENLNYNNADKYFEEEFEKDVSEISNDQLQFNNIFGFKSENNIPKVEVKNKSISNGRKVLLTIICSIIPGFGQLFCLILSLGYMNSEENEDMKSFGQALFVAALVLFVLTCIISFVIALAIYQPLI